MATTASPPRAITRKEFERDWEPHGWKLLAIGPTETYRGEEWGEWEAIRDLVQNALDETEAYQSGYDERGFWIADTGGGVVVRDFLLGAKKVKPDYARGKFGEGLKLALITLMREGYGIQVVTVGRELWPIWLIVETDPGEYAEQLHVLWRTNGSQAGTRFHIIGYKGPDYRNNFAVNLPRRAILAEGPSPLEKPIDRYNQLIDPSYTDGPKIYGRDIYMQYINSPFSYNLWGFHMSPDRHGPVEESHMWADVGRLWCCITNRDHIRVFLQMVHDPPLLEADESRRVRMFEYDMGREPRSGKPYSDFIRQSHAVWRDTWKSLFGANTVIRTSPRWDNIVKHLGYTSHSVYHGAADALRVAITTDKDLVDASADRLRDTEIVPDSKLNAWQRAHLSLARALVENLTPMFTGRNVKAVHAAAIPPASDRVRTAGMYNTTTTEIFIDMNTLDSGRATVDAAIHELAHHTSQAEDLEPKHSEHMSMLSGYAVEATHRRDFDDLMKDVSW